VAAIIYMEWGEEARVHREPSCNGRFYLIIL